MNLKDLKNSTDVGDLRVITYHIPGDTRKVVEGIIIHLDEYSLDFSMKDHDRWVTGILYPNEIVSIY